MDEVSLAVWDDPLAANGLQTDADDALIYLALLLGPTSTLALRRAIGVPFVPDHVVLISEYQRSLTERNVGLALALPVTSVPYDPAIARAIDAGLLAARLPRCLANSIAQLPV